MKHLSKFTIAAALLSLAPAGADDAATAGVASLSITVSGIEKIKGDISLGLYNEAGFESGEFIEGLTLPIEGDTVTTMIEGLAPGVYGIKLYHDMNSDGALGTNPFGIPNEPYAFSNNANGRFGPPKWADASFEVTADGASQSISLK